MPDQTSYPGVFVEETQRPPQPIAGVANSITAFVGRALRGPVDSDPQAPVAIKSYLEFEHVFGGLWRDSTLGYAVRDFFLNGGNEAVIVRVHNGATAATFDLPTTAPASHDILALEAASVGAWGNQLSIVVDHATENPADARIFNLKVTAADGASESFPNLSIDPASTRFVPRVLEESSSLLRVRVDNDGQWAVPDIRPAAGGPCGANAGSASDGAPITAAEVVGSAATKTGLHALGKVDLFNLLCIPPLEPGGDTPAPVYQDALAYAVSRRAMLLVDPPVAWTANPASAVSVARTSLSSLGLTGDAARNAALYFPRLREVDPLRDNQLGLFAPCGAVAGIFARTDTQHGVWKAPAGTEATLHGTLGLEINLTNADEAQLNPVGINCFRSFSISAPVVWGSRTLRGADLDSDEYKYIPVRRLALFIEESLDRGTRWATFEPNAEPLWNQLRLQTGDFLQKLFVQGAFRGNLPREAYFVKCGRDTTPQEDIDHGVINLTVGFAPLKPAEFVVIRLQRITSGNDLAAVTLRGPAMQRTVSIAAHRHIISTTPSAVRLPPQTLRQLREIAAHLRQRSRGLTAATASKRHSHPAGLGALFAGPSGSGKTLAAEVLASESKLELHRIDSSQIVSRHLQETEKNLRHVFGTAHDSGAILLFDEADALFGRRTEVKDSHDRYANLETSYLLQRMEAHRGLTILATNDPEKIPRAVRHRLHFVLPFPPPPDGR